MAIASSAKTPLVRIVATILHYIVAKAAAVA